MTLANRLCAFFLVAVAILIVGFSVVLELLIGSHLYHDLDERLAGVLEQMGAEVVDHPGRVEWRPGLWRPAPDLDQDDPTVEWAALAPDGRVLERSPGFPDAAEGQILALRPESGHRHATIDRASGARWRLAIRRKRPAAATSGRDPDQEPDDEGPEAPGSSSLSLVSALPLGPLESSLSRASLVLGGSSAAIWLLAAFAGRRACRRALRPMARMAEAARLMSAADRGQDLPSPGTHDELESLAGAFNGLLGRLHEALERQDRFAGDASHQLRTPLTALIGEIEVARRRDRSAADYREILDDLHAEAHHLRQIVESLLFLARADAEAGRPDLEPVDLAAWLADRLRGGPIGARGRDLRGEIPAGLACWARVQPSLLGQLVDNLLENAAKYSEPGTPIVVRLGRTPGSVTLAVEDRGCGIDPGDLAHLFEPFYRSERARRLGRPGVGLGLSVVQRIAEAFGGAVRAEGEPGLWARFTVELPGG